MQTCICVSLPYCFTHCLSFLIWFLHSTVFNFVEKIIASLFSRKRYHSVLYKLSGIEETQIQASKNIKLFQHLSDSIYRFFLKLLLEFKPAATASADSFYETLYLPAPLTVKCCLLLDSVLERPSTRGHYLIPDF